MNPSDIKTPADVAKWLKNHVEWSDEASRDMMLAAVSVLTTCGKEVIKDDRAAVLRETLDAIPQDICTHDGCDEGTCPLTRVNVAISALLDK